MGAAQEGPLSVHEAVTVAGAHVDAIPSLVVTGEVSGFRGPNARSGHCYFQLKDDQSAMDAIVWRGTYQKCGFALRDGLKVVMGGKFNVYKGSGRLSFVARTVSLAGEGALRQKVAELARKLEAEGLMAQERKRPIPRFCTRVCVVTSLSGSVIDDVKRTLARRNPLVQIQEVGCSVQGPGAPATIIRALRIAAEARPDAILLVRGGGSFEDLMTFNDEALARAVAASPVPIVTGIGHEPDTSICDMVSDRRCSTPTAAAESVAPALEEIIGMIEDRRTRLVRTMQGIVRTDVAAVDQLDGSSRAAMRAYLDKRRLYVESMASRKCLTDPYATIEDRSAQLNMTEERLVASMPRVMSRLADGVEGDARSLRAAIPGALARAEKGVSQSGRALGVLGTRLLAPYEGGLARMAGQLDALSPLRVLGRGYAIARGPSGHVVSDASRLAPGDTVSVLLGKGSFEATVSAVDAAGKSVPER